MPESSRKPRSPGQRALVVGVGDYPKPIPKLPAVAADVREMAKLLRSKDGAFPSSGVTVLTDKQATRRGVLDALRAAFGGAASDETVFVYLAGHGGVEGDAYYFVAHDTDVARMKATGVALHDIKALFDESPSSRVFLWLDFCHSGGILARGTPVPDDQAVIKRTLGVIRGHGKVIVAACTPGQSAYESQDVGHGLFTDALLRGFRGGAESGGEVTVNSLFDFIDREVGSHRQRPMFLGQTTGRLVLMHFQDRGDGDLKASAPMAGKQRPTSKDGTWVMLGRHYFLAEAVRSNKDGSITLVVTPANGEEEADLASLRPGPYGGGSTLPFAWNNDARTVRVTEVESEMVSGRHAWTIALAPQGGDPNGGWNEMSINTGSMTYSADDIAKLRAGRILLNDPPEKSDRDRSHGSDSFLESCIRGSSGRCEVRTSPIRAVYAEHGRNPNWKHFARLQVVHTLKASGTVGHILDLTFGAVRSGGLPVRFRGRRDRPGADKSTIIELSGTCPLG